MQEGPKFNLRKAGEGSDVDPKWKKATIYKKENEEEEEAVVYLQRSTVASQRLERRMLFLFSAV